MGPIRRRMTRLAATAVAILVGAAVAVGPAAPAQAAGLAEITYFDCDPAPYSFTCEVQAVVYAGYWTHTQWTINGTHYAAYDYMLDISHGCGYNPQMTVRVDLISYWNLCWCVRDSETRVFRCRLAQ
jgi:hypothetical protein